MYLFLFFCIFLKRSLDLEQQHPPKLAIFDLDHTLLSANSSFKFGSYLYSIKAFSTLSMCRLVAYYVLHKSFGTSIETLHQQVFKQLFYQKSLLFFQQHIQHFINIYYDSLLYHPAVKRLKELQEKGVYTVILSGSPELVVAGFAERLCVNEWHATTYSVDKDGLLCKISNLMEGEEKAKYCIRLASRFEINKEAIEAYSDSLLDLPLLQAAGRAIAVNPDKKLLRISREEKWEIL